jgi:hypothetical protein
MLLGRGGSVRGTKKSERIGLARKGGPIDERRTRIEPRAVLNQIDQVPVKIFI